MDEQTLRRFARYLIKRMKQLHHQRDVYRAVLQTVKDDGFPGIDERVKDAFGSPDILAATEAAFAGFDELIPPTAEVDPDSALARLIQEYGLDEGKMN